MNFLRSFFTVLAVIFSFQFCNAEISIARIFSDNMVLQRNLNVKIWGSSDPKEKLVIRFNDQNRSTIADKTGKWMITLAPMEAGGPFEMIISGSGDTLRLQNILVGDVWICSGQSNMQWQVNRSNNAENEIKMANHPNIRLFNVPKNISSQPLDNMSKSSWLICTPENIATFSAVGYYFGRDLQSEIDVPIGLINSTWGGTCVESWTSKESILKLSKYEDFGERIDGFDIEKIKTRNRNTLKNIIGDWPLQEKGLEEKWMLPGFDRSDWQQMEMPGFWEDKGFSLLDGLVWFNYDFMLDTEDINQKAYLSLGKIDNSDMTWVNGQKVGEMQWSRDIERVYTLPDNLLKPGRNNITIRVDDRWGNGGVDAGDDNFFIMVGQKSIPIGGEWQFKIDQVYDNFKPSPNEVPSLLYNAMIHPLIPYGIKGVIWYQGENNTPRAKEYAITFPNMIQNWRENWQQDDFPFLFVQLANFQQPKQKPANDNWAELRESQTKTLALVNTGMAVTIDIGEADDIHPRNKQDVGNRLMYSALKVAYNKDVVHSGPIYKSMQIEGDKAIISFDNVDSGLVVKSKHGYINEFEIAGIDKNFYWEKAEIDGNRVIVESDQVEKPVAVRFAWSINPAEFNLYNKEGLPASPFRTDNWKGVTDGKSFDD